MQYNPLIGGSVPVVENGDRRNPTLRMDESSAVVVVDGTPVRVALLALSAAVSLTALRWAGFRFNVGVST